MKRILQIVTITAFSFFIIFNLHNGTSVARSSEKPANNSLPEIADLRYDKIGIGQRLTFGIEVIDEESDFIKVELTEKPTSAKFNQNTLTVDWTPTKTDGEKGVFQVRVTEIPRDKSRKQRVVEKTYEIKIVPEKVKLKELPPTTLEVNALVSIIDPERLAAANEKWDMLSFFQRAAEIEAEKQIDDRNMLRPATGETLFKDSLKQLAMLHKNPEIDPDSDKFNKVWEASNWKLIAVRPRINKKVFELRLVYFNDVAAEQAYLMPRMRIIRGGDAERPEKLRQMNNELFIKMFHEAFFDGKKLKKFVKDDKRAYGNALADFITKVLTYRHPEEPMLRANFAALPHNSRLGGGNTYDENGKYLHGDGWLLGALKITPVVENGSKRLGVTSPPMAGFVASIKKNGKGFAKSKAPVNDPKSPAFRAGWDAMYDEVNHTVHVAEKDETGKLVKLNVDTAENAFEWKSRLMVAETPLRDPRRRLFEEKGMTCIQCHVRNFDEGDYLASVKTPGEEQENVFNRKIPRLFFIITPSLHNGRNEYIHREEQEQVGNLKGAIRDYLGIHVDIASPLAIDWPFDTRKGRS